jgi:F-type H+-transporting ATPase subunit delta
VAKASPAVREAVTELLQQLPSPAERQRAGEDLLALATVLDHEPRLRSALTDPSVEPARKVQLLRDVFRDQVSAAAVDAVAAIAGQRLRGRELVEVVEEVGAQALMDVADEAGTLADVEEQLYGFAGLVERDHALRSALTDPGLPADRKRAVVDELLGGRADPRAMALTAHWVARDLAGQLSRLVESTLSDAADRRDRVVAEVTSAVPLDGEQRSRLTETFARIVGKPVDLQVQLDPEVVGSLSVRIGDEVYDGTVKRQLERARELLGAA